MMTHKQSLATEAAAVAADLLEPEFDKLIVSPVIKEIPILGLAVRLAATAASVRDHLFAARVDKFVRSLGAIDDAEIAQMLFELKRDVVLRERVGTVLLFSIERLDELEKATLLAKAFRAFLRGRVNLPEFRRIALAVNNAFLDDLQRFVALDDPGKIGADEAKFALMAVGISRTNQTATNHGDIVHVSITVTDFGRLFWNTMREH